MFAQKFCVYTQLLIKEVQYKTSKRFYDNRFYDNDLACNNCYNLWTHYILHLVVIIVVYDF